MTKSILLFAERNVKYYGALGDGDHDDTTSIQAAIDAAAVSGGRVYFPPGTYKISASLILKNGVTICGVMPSATSASSLSWDIGFDVDTGSILTYPGGVVFTQPATAGIGTLSALTGVTIEDMGFNDVASVLAIGRSNESGLCESVIRNVIASAVTGFGFDMTNPLHVRMDFIKVSGTQLLRITSDYDAAVLDNQPGNCVFTDLYGFISAAGHALPSIHIRALDTNSAGRYLNYLHFVRLQINRFMSSDHTGNALRIEGEGNAAIVNNCTFDGLDLEGASEHRIYIDHAQGTRINFVGHAANGTDCDADIYARNSTGLYVTNTDQGVILDLDSTAQPMFWHGFLRGVTGGGLYPMGEYLDLTPNKVRLSLSQYGDTTLLATYDHIWTMPANNKIVFNTAGGGVMDGVTSVPGSAWINPTRGLALLTNEGDQGVQLEDATTCTGQRITLKKTASGGTATIYPINDQTVDGAVSNTWLDTQHKYITLQSDGANWLIVAKG